MKQKRQIDGNSNICNKNNIKFIHQQMNSKYYI